MTIAPGSRLHRITQGEFCNDPRLRGEG
jgi:hypothetical protein